MRPVEFHDAVMVREVEECLNVRSGLFVDATAGAGAHSAAMLRRLEHGEIVAIDLDRRALEFCRQRFASEPRVTLVHGNFGELGWLLRPQLERWPGIAGIVFDLGLSYHQATSPGRGFSYQSDGVLDMRFDPDGEGPSARDFLRRVAEPELTRVLREYGDEPFARRIARRIHEQRGRLDTTAELARLVRSAVPFRFQAKSVMRVFQAVRIAVNRELENLQAGLTQALDLLTESAVLAVLSYHSGEDRVCKSILRAARAAGRVELLTRKPRRPEAAEIAQNPSARSALLRAARKLAVTGVAV
jgi:16S rRNA (cytosine1402-N4)-methyltransferase